MFLVGMGMDGVTLTFLLTCTLSAHYIDHVAWVGYGDGWGDVNVRVMSLAVDLQLAIQIQQRQRPLDSCGTCLGAHPRRMI